MKIKNVVRSVSNSMVVLALSYASIGRADTILISDDFSGSSTNPLLGTAPDTYAVPGGGGVWESSSAGVADSFKADGSVTVGDHQDNIFLDFTPESGNIYKLRTTISPTVGANYNLLEFGFASAYGRIASQFGRGYVGLSYDGWIIRSPGNNGQQTDSSNYYADGTAVTFELTLDATDASATNWTMGLTGNGTEIFAPTTTTANLSEINYVGFSLNGSPTGTYDNFQLVVVPEPGSLTLLVLGGVAALWAGHKRRRH